MNEMSRRRFMAAVVAAGAALPLTGFANSAKGKKTKICVFSKHLQWLDYDGMARTAADIGFDSVDLTVRPGGHVLPERVEDDLPRAVEAMKKAGLPPLMMTTAINDPDDPVTEKILKTASALGIRYYRMGYFRYADDKSITQTLAEIKPKMKALAEMNKHFKIHGAYQNHSGSKYFGSPVWDIWEVIKDLDPAYMGCQFDIRHATVEGGTSWAIHLRLLARYIKTRVAKDFVWAHERDKWKVKNCPLGQGMVNFDAYMAMSKKLAIAAPFSLHFEYPLGGAEHGKRKLTVDKSVVINAMRRDLGYLRKVLSA